MFIKRLELFGFKTFAEKTTVEMGQGVTAVVGPNGCGKSNIADALQWVLGESNVRNIRGQKAVDVIFYGSEKRKSLGMAEVSLTLDNTCGTLPINYSEVTVTRRAYRSGESEYLINKTKCRLKDIYELFLDTGAGREAYSFVTQGEIDAILSAKPEDRRELIEEAAGIKKYRYKRQEALRKLDKTEANLTRVCDIMSELEGQIEPLREQAEQAEKFNELQTRLREIEVGLLVRDLKRHTQTLEEVRASKVDAEKRIAECDKLLADLEWEKDKQSGRLSALEEEVEEARHVVNNLTSNVQRLESRSALIEERLKSAASARDQAKDDMTSLDRKITETRDRISRLEVEQSEFVESEQKIRAEVEAKSQRLAELDAQYEQASRIVNDQKASYLELAKELAAKRNALQNSKDRLSQLEQVLSKYRSELDGLEAQKREALERQHEAEAEIEKLKEDVQQKAAEIATLTDERKSYESQVNECNRRLSELNREVASRSSRLSTLREMAESHEGFFEGVRTVMAARKAGKLRGEFAVVADVISVPKGYETAIEIALGASLQDIITDSVSDAKSAIAFLRDNRAGRATFLPLDNMRPSTTQVKGRMDPRSGALGVAADLIDYDRKYDVAIQSLLGRTVLAETIDDAVALSRSLSGWNKIVTLDGELIVPSGAMTGGARKNRGPELLHRKQEIDSLTKEIKDLERSTVDVQNKVQLAQASAAKCISNIEDAEKLLGDTRISLAEAQRRADYASKEVERIGRQLEMVSLERDEAESMQSEERTTVERLETELQNAGKENIDLDQRVTGAEKDMERLQTERADAREELMQLNVELASRTERCTAVRNSLSEARSILNELESTKRSRESQVGIASSDLSQLSSEKESIEQELKTQRDILSAAEKRLSELVETRSQENQKSFDLDSRLRKAGQERNQLAQDTHDADVKEARLEVQVNQASERLMEEYEVSYEQAMEWPDDDLEVERGTATEVARIRREIKDMGPVNTGAIQEYERVKERWEFLTEQRTDLENARDQIRAAIREIDTNTRGLFMETFNAVAGNFDRMFKRLFNGGKTELTLTDPSDLLETGIEVIVQPPGKKLQDLGTLSGGERALSATAFIFALLLSKPSPFVLMDEVDAPLDESNVERFAEVLKEFSQNSQFIVVTHNRATMEAADNLYGVTMQEPGVSKIISVRLAESDSTNNDASADEGEFAKMEV